MEEHTFIILKSKQARDAKIPTWAARSGRSGLNNRVKFLRFGDSFMTKHGCTSSLLLL